ncbi:glycoside hydrolase family 65 protein [Lacticaseibacillus mingshuiensis]|uniref:glycoside hydrolase family 65 protein n=1 Tax=Lacticaseibacillus mingshuiensis TaxID=2799574 RepID=UPI00194E5BB6|nr:glycoside hydrolase family 65 protein [Lacticaseibacillus mingshuiensis]
MNSDWLFTQTGYDPEDLNGLGNRFMLANGYMGYRGVLEEYGKKQLVALNLGGVYDRNGDKWRETVNAPDPMTITLTRGDQAFSVLKQSPLAHTMTLDCQHAKVSRHTVFQAPEGTVTITSERFLSAAATHYGALQYHIEADFAGDFTLRAGIDHDVWDINGPHLFNYAQTVQDDTFCVFARTGEKCVPIAVWQNQFLDAPAEASIERATTGLFRNYQLHLTANVPVTLTVFFGVSETERDDNAIALAMRGVQASDFATWQAAHEAVWAKWWAQSDIEIDGPVDDQRALRYSLYQLLAIAPHGVADQSIPARGLSGQTYKGAIFWDTEMFMLPFFLATDAETARSLVGYRIRGLQAAKQKAASYGFQGAFYAWESQENGFDATSDFNVTDVFTKRPMRTYFRDKQVHISGAIALSIWQTAQWLNDPKLLLSGGAEVILECARFYLDYVKQGLLDDTIVCDDVIGPDEYHERVNNNAYTNKIIEETWRAALAVIDWLQKQAPSALKTMLGQLHYADLPQLIAASLPKLKQPLVKDGVIAQFDGYFGLEDTTVEAVRSRLLDPREYWGGAYGVASQTQVIKQADVMMMLALFPQDYSPETHQQNYAYYEPRTEHGSSLSWSMYAIEAARLGLGDAAHDFFVKTATVDLTGQSKQWAGSIYIGGTHPAANGGAWLVAMRGFAGMQVRDGQLEFKNQLPPQWRAMRFHVGYHGRHYSVTLKAGQEQPEVEEN